MALSSIYDESFSLLSSHGEPLDPSLLISNESELISTSHPISFDCLVHVDASDGVKIIESAAGSSSSVTRDQMVKHLPPIQLRLTLPNDYPSKRAPEVYCHAIWLSADQLRHLEGSVASMWLPDEPLGYQAIDWLQHQALRVACLENRTLILPDNVILNSGSLLSPSDRMSMRLAGATAASSSNDAGPSNRSSCMAAPRPQFDLFTHLTRYDASLTLSDFRSSLQTCGICYDSRPGSTFVVLPCSANGGPLHAYCRACLTQHCTSLISSGAVEHLKCPEPSCRASIPPFVLAEVLNEDEYDKYETLALKKALASMPDLSYCPRCDAATIAGKDDDCCQCPQCLFVFCGKCLGAYHPSERCLSALEQMEMKALIDERRQNNKLTEEEKRRKRADLVAQMQSMAIIQITTKPCPCCGAAIEKSEGCNKMSCSSCNSLFCWRCLTVIPKDVGYAHFGGEKCQLFEQREIVQWERLNGAARDRHEARVYNQAMFQVMVEDVDGQLQMRPVYCRMCGQMNVREGNNNLVRCWACRGYTCAACREPLRSKPGSHFGSKEWQCRQHS